MYDRKENGRIDIVSVFGILKDDNGIQRVVLMENLSFFLETSLWSISKSSLVVRSRSVIYLTAGANVGATLSITLLGTKYNP
jgi:hypothetical protein